MRGYVMLKDVEIDYSGDYMWEYKGCSGGIELG